MIFIGVFIVIKVNWHGRLGNQLFQYALGRILAEGLGYSLESDSIDTFSATRDKIFGISISDTVSLTGQVLDLGLIERIKGKRGISLDGWFQRYEYYRPHKEKIRSWFNRDLNRPDKVLSKKDLVIHIRRTQLNGLDNRATFNVSNGYGETA